MVINIGALKDRNLELVARDIRGVVDAAHARGAIVKVIIETALLTTRKNNRLPGCQRSRRRFRQDVHRFCRRRRHR